MKICHEQPHLIPPPRPEPRQQRSGSRSSVHPSQWAARSRSLASRASSLGGAYVHRRSRILSSRHPTIGAPSDFRRIENLNRRPEGFRPLELSIYLPENRLSPLPTFYEEDDEDDDMLEPEPAYLARTMSILSVPSSTFSIRRKPVGSSVSLPLAEARPSVDTRSTPASVGSEWMAQPLRPRPSMSSLLSQASSTLPVKPTHAHSQSLPASYGDGDFSGRLSKRLEERPEYERRFTSFDTIPEERRSSNDQSFEGELMDFLEQAGLY